MRKLIVIFAVLFLTLGCSDGYLQNCPVCSPGPPTIYIQLVDDAESADAFFSERISVSDFSIGTKQGQPNFDYEVVAEGEVRYIRLSFWEGISLEVKNGEELLFEIVTVVQDGGDNCCSWITMEDVFVIGAEYEFSALQNLLTVHL